jgi:polyhydroxyalkanoate synthesis regulator phasin
MPGPGPPALTALEERVGRLERAVAELRDEDRVGRLEREVAALREALGG